MFSIMKFMPVSLMSTTNHTILLCFALFNHPRNSVKEFSVSEHSSTICKQIDLTPPPPLFHFLIALASDTIFIDLRHEVLHLAFSIKKKLDTGLPFSLITFNLFLHFCVFYPFLVYFIFFIHVYLKYAIIRYFHIPVIFFSFFSFQR